MKLKLTKLTEKITPLPWKVDGLKILAETRGVIATCPTPTSGGTFDVQLNKAYLVHCANVLPKLVAALEGVLSLDKNPNCSASHYNEVCESARLTVALAREVEI